MQHTPFFQRCQCTAAVLLALSMGGCAAQAVRQNDAALPAPANLSTHRMALLAPADDLKVNEDEHPLAKMKVYLVLRGIDKARGQDILMDPEVMIKVGTPSQLTTRFKTAVEQTQRFHVFDSDVSGVKDKTSIFVEAQFTSTQQRLENIGLGWKVLTTVRLALKIRDTETGSVIDSRNFAGFYGQERGEGSPILSAADANRGSAPVMEQSASGFDNATERALHDAAKYLEEAFRPVGKVREVDGDALSMSGGTYHGFAPGDTVVIFKTSFRKEGGKPVPGLMKVLAVAQCPGVNAESSTCQITHLNKGEKIEPNQFVAVADAQQLSRLKP